MCYQKRVNLKTYLSNRRSAIVLGTFSFPYSAAGIVKYMQNKPVEKITKTPKAATNSHRFNGTFPSNFAPIGFFVVGESSAFSSSIFNRLVSISKLLGAAIDDAKFGSEVQRKTLDFIALNYCHWWRFLIKKLIRKPPNFRVNWSNSGASVKPLILAANVKSNWPKLGNTV